MRRHGFLRSYNKQIRGWRFFALIAMATAAAAHQLRYRRRGDPRMHGTYRRTI